jgi:SAM-dependent methyltransferase
MGSLHAHGDRTTLVSRIDSSTLRRPDSIASWRTPVANTESTLHQLSPYIGKLKSSIAADLVNRFSKPGDTIADPFCGAGTIALEAQLAGRHVFASDISPYAYTLTHAKLRAPICLSAALGQVEALLQESATGRQPDLRAVPVWVRRYFNSQTLKEAISFASACKRHGSSFGLSCLLGILHHQRPGFLSYPSSHLVPYLRSKRFPLREFPELYEYRPLRPRLLAKVSRAYKRFQGVPPTQASVAITAIEDLVLPTTVDVVITSPPYMNALDYGRDNRLRLWFLDPGAADRIDENTPRTMGEFTRLMKIFAEKVHAALKHGGHCVIVVGDSVSRDTTGHTADAVLRAFVSAERRFALVGLMRDTIPDVRRSRRDCRGVKGEHILVLQRK